MVNVAVVGGTGRLGRTVVEVLQEHHEHSVVVLGRKVRPLFSILNEVIDQG